MSDTALTTRENAAIIEQVVINGDLSKLTPGQRVDYYRQVCASLGLNPLTKPFDYITLNGKLTLYARKDCADQLRQLHGISIEKPDIRFEDDWIIVTVEASDKDGRTDSDVGVVSKKDMRGDFGNALMKAVTKAKRRVTLSICGLGMLDETEIESVPTARPVTVESETGEIIHPAPTPAKPGNGNGKPRTEAAVLEEIGFPPEPEDAPPIEGETIPAHVQVIPKERPYPPAALKKVIEKKAAAHKASGKTISTGARGLMVSLLDGLFQGNAETKTNKRHQLCAYLTGYGSTKNMPAEYANALLDWMQYDQSVASKEAEAVVTSMAVDAGQEALL